MRAPARPITDEDRDAIRRLHAQGKGRNAIARELRRSGRTISNLAAELGLTFERGPEVAAATQARTADLAALRAQLALDLTHDAMKLREQLWAPSKVYNFGGKDNTYEEMPVTEPPADAKRALMGTAGMAIDRSLKLAPPKNDDGSTEIGSLLTGLFDRLRDQHGDS